jgi:hypothetical protein
LALNFVIVLIKIAIVRSALENAGMLWARLGAF